MSLKKTGLSWLCRPENMDAVEPPATAILAGLLHELQDVPQPICDLMLQSLAAGEANPAAQR